MSDGLRDLEQLLNGDSTSPDSGQSGGKLRQQLEAVLAERNELKAQLAQVQTAQRETQLSSLFTKHSVPPLARDFFPKDAELTDEAVTGFIEKYGQLWGAEAAPATVPAEQQAAANAAQAFAAQSTQAPAAPLSEEAYRAKFAETNSREEFLKVLSELSAVGE